MNERELTARVKAGDEAAERALYDAHVDRVYWVAYRMSGRHDLAQDFTQDVFIRAFDRIADFRGDAPFGAWLHTIATRLGIDHHRRNRARLVSLTQPEEGTSGEERTIDLEDPTAGPEEEAEQSELARRLEALVMELPPDSRAAILLRHQHDLPYEEIAQALGAPLGTIKAWIHRARLMLKEKLLAQGDIPWDVDEHEEGDR